MQSLNATIASMITLSLGHNQTSTVYYIYTHYERSVLTLDLRKSLYVLSGVHPVNSMGHSSIAISIV